MKIGDYINKYLVKEILGSGGNGKVFLVEKNGQQYAMKVLKYQKGSYWEKKYLRFKREIEIVKREQNNIKGIIPIIEAHLPNKNKCSHKNLPWYVMELAEPFDVLKIKEKSIEDIVNIIVQLSDILEKLHNKGIVHRDIKPGNLFFYKGQPAFGDFGLVDYPEAFEITSENESVGPKYTIAPEVKRNAKIHDGKLADIYSLAKTLWILITGKKDGFEGQYSYRVKTFNLLNYRPEEMLSILNELLERSTSNIPTERPMISEFKQKLELFLSSTDEEKMRYEWDYVLNNLFNYGIPESAQWKNPKQISFILNELTLLGYLNHMFMPGGGGMDLEGVSLSNEEGFIEFDFGFTHKCKPKKLYLETFENSDWNYFYLELDELKDINITKYDSTGIYDVVEIEPGKYIDGWNYNYNRNMLSATHEKLPSSARNIQLILKGNFVLFNKWSKYNKESSTYFPYQDLLSPVEFKKCISEWIKNPHFINYMKNTYIKYTEKIELKPVDTEDFSFEEIRNIFDKINLKSSDTTNETFLYNLNITINNTSYRDRFDVKIENNIPIIEENDGTMFMSSLLKENKETSYTKEDILRIVNTLKKEFSKLSGKEEPVYTLKAKRIKKPTYLFTREDIKKVLLQGDSFKFNALIINENGEVKLVNDKMWDLNAQFYSAYVCEFPSKQNLVGEYADLESDVIDSLYYSCLNYWHEHLITKKRVQKMDYFKNYTIKELEDKIKTYY